MARISTSMKDILQDPRYPDFVARYHADPLRFAVEATGFIPSADQARLFRGISSPRALVSVVSGTGCFAKGTMMMRSDGSAVAVEDVRVGDRLMGPDGASVRNVLELKRGREEMYRFRLEDGTEFEFNLSHILTLANGRGEVRNVTVREWLREWARENAPEGGPWFFYRLIDRAPARYVALNIEEVTALGDGDYYGFVLDGDHRFLAHDCTVLHNTGKTASFARIALWHLLCFPVATYEGKTEIGSNTYIGAPLIQQVADGVWKEMKDALIAIKNGPHAWIADYFTISKTRVVVKGYEAQWFITQIAMAKGESIGVAGKHRYWQLIIIDEAAGVPDEHFNVIQGTQTQGGNRTLLASQGARSAGFFYETHHTLAKENGGSWLNLRFNSEEAPWVTSEWLADRALESGGRNSVEYQVRVLGLFAQSSANVLLTRDVLDRAFEPRQIINPDEPWGYLILCDVGLGEYRDDSVVIVAKVMGNGDFGKDARRVEFVEIPIASNDKQVPDLTGDLVNLFGRLPNATLAVDAGGIGAVVVKELERQNIPVVPINWGAPCFSSEYKKRFYNKRACAMVRFRDAVRDGRVVLPQGISRRLREKILTEGTRLPYHFSEAGSLRYVMDSKEDMRRQGIKSPDLIDAMAFAFLEGMNYMAAGTDTGGEHETAANRAAREAAELFADI